MQQVGHRGTRSHRPLTRLVAGTAGVFMAILALASANSVQADSVWMQSYERSSQTQECVAQSWETPWQASWGSDSSWKPSWEQWANGGTGGWTCTRSIVWARSEGVTYRLGDIGPGGGLVFYIDSVSGLRYEMAPKTWNGSQDPNPESCNADTNIPGATGTAIGTGAVNTAATVAACTSGASNDAAAYRGGGFTDWFLPSKDELNAIFSYAIPADKETLYEFFPGNSVYWSSSQVTPYNSKSWSQNFTNGDQSETSYNSSLFVRPIRAF